MKLSTSTCAMITSLFMVMHANANETCATAEVIVLTSVAECTSDYTYGDNGSADVTLNTPSCDATTNGIQDLWYAFNSLNNTTVNVYLGPVSMTDHAFAVFQGCGGPQVACVIQPNGYVAVPTSQNTEYRIQVYSNNDYGFGGEFGVCAMWTTPPSPPPANDDCTGSILLAVNTTCVFSNGTSAFATSSSIGATCWVNDDVWYRFVAPAAPVSITVDGDGNGTAGYDPSIVLQYASGCGGSFNTVLCANATGPGATETMIVDFLAPGNAYYIRVTDVGADVPNPPTFRICVQADVGAGLSEEGALANWSVRGDAVGGRFLISGSGRTIGSARVEVLDLLGRCLLSETLAPSNNTDHGLDLSSLPSGVYLISIAADGERYAQRVWRY